MLNATERILCLKCILVRNIYFYTDVHYSTPSLAKSSHPNDTLFDESESWLPILSKGDNCGETYIHYILHIQTLEQNEIFGGGGLRKMLLESGIPPRKK